MLQNVFYDLIPIEAFGIQVDQCNQNILCLRWSTCTFHVFLNKLPVEIGTQGLFASHELMYLFETCATAI